MLRPPPEDNVAKLDSTRAPVTPRRRKGDTPTTLVNGRFELTKKLGEGSFGMVFLGMDTKSDREVAIKLESLKSSAAGQLTNEARIIELLSRPLLPQGFTEVHYHGKDGNYALLAMDRLGFSFEDSVEVMRGRLDAVSCAIAAEQGLKLLAYLHSKCMVHRDIKSENFMWGVGPKAHHLYLIDFGMTCKYWSSTNKKHVALSCGKDMTGTARYASINAMKGYTQSRRDDIEAYAHVLLYALRGSLPWSGLDAPTYEAKLKRICETKAQTPIPELCKGHPKEFEVLLGYSRKLTFEERPNYAALINSFNSFRTSQDPPAQDYDLAWIDQRKIDVEALEPLAHDPLPPSPEEQMEAAASGKAK